MEIPANRASGEPLRATASPFVDALAGMLAGMRLDDAADLLCQACEPEVALRGGCVVLPNLLARFRLHCGSRSMEWWLTTLEQSKVRTLSRRECESFLILCASDAGGVSFPLPDNIRASTETRRLVAGLLQLATLIAVALQQIGHSRQNILVDCQRNSTT